MELSTPSLEEECGLNIDNKTLKKEPCTSHEPMAIVIITGPYAQAINFDFSGFYKCKHCGVSIKADWITVK